ncbi:GNAT family N-acetyltransferase [Kocuria palustris]|uniref:GNAT family N-acetyltransferase n=1 Tax=Kocuria palustris TaxID=71999 RepID=UPI0011A799E4|nr:GNAT family N-acetyltransferase [Kocuria palustris]
MDSMQLPGTSVVLEEAAAADLPELIDLLTDDHLGAVRDGIRTEDDRRRYERAFAAIDEDPAHLLVIGRLDGRAVATLQLTVIPSLSRRGAVRTVIEGVRISSSLRGRGVGGALVRWAVEQARDRGCDLVQLTSDKQRPDAHRFYERLGFERSHEGFKLDLRGA